MREKLVLLGFLLTFLTVKAQKIEFKILDINNLKPIENASIFDRFDNLLAVTKSDGTFEIEKQELGLIIKVKSLNYQELQFNLSADQEDNIIYLSPFSQPLAEVLVRSSLISTKIKELPAAVSVISTEDLKRIDASNLIQAFNNVPGVYVSQGALNTTKLNIRGIGSRSQYSTNKIQAYFEGIPLTTGEGELTLDDFDPETISSIEIFKGPTSSMYGAGLGGAINIYGKDAGTKGANLKVESLIGSYNLMKNNISANIGSQKTSVFAHFSDLRSDGYRDNGNYERRSALVNFSIKMSEKDQLNLLANFTHLKAYIPSSINYEDYQNSPSSAAFTWEASRGYESYDRGLLGISYKHSFSDNLKNTTSIFINFRDAYEPRPFDILEENRISTGARTKFNYKTELFQLPSEISFGAAYYKEWYEISNFQNLYRNFEDKGSAQGEILNKNKQDRKYANFFAQINLELSEKWHLEYGFNINTTSYALTDLFKADEIDQSGDYSFKTIFSPRLAVLYKLDNSKNLYASVSHGFSTPTVAETLTPEGLINTDLQPEKGINYEVGFKGSWIQNRLFTQVSLYSIQVDNLLVAERVAEDRYVGINAGKSDHNGIEFQVNYNLYLAENFNFKPYINGSLNFFKFDEFIDSGKDYSGNVLPGVPKSTVNVGLDFSYKNTLNIYSNFLAVGKIPLNDANSGYSESYQLLNLKAAYRFQLRDSWNLSINGGVSNLLNEKYASSILPNAVGFGGNAPRSYYPGNPRNYFGGVGLNYDF